MSLLPTFSPWPLLAGLLLAAAAGMGGFVLGQDHEKAGQADRAQLTKDAVNAANEVWAANVVKLKPRYTTIQGKLEKEIETHTVYRDCKLPPDGLQLLNAALAGGAQPAGGGELPAPGAPAK